MPEWGIDDEGISTPSYSQILDYFSKRWEEEFGTEADLSSRTAEGQFFRNIAESISNKGLPWSDITSIWDTIEDLYYAGYIPTASGAPLDYLVKLRNLTRRGSQPAKGTVLFSAEQGSEIESGTIVETDSGVEFETTRPVTANQYDVAPVPAIALEEGDESNVISETITQSDGYDVNNPNDAHVYHIGSIIDEWATIENDETANKYQKLGVNKLKYATNVNRIDIPLKSTSSGLYAVKTLVMDYESGEVIFETEVKEKELSEDSRWDAIFRGEGFDMLSEPVSDNIRIAPINLSYSTDDIKVALQNETTTEDWFSGVNPQPNKLVAKITSEIEGKFTGGSDRESDSELKSRYFSSLSRGGSARPASIEAELYQTDSVKHVNILENNKAIDLRPNGLPPNSIEVVVWGGSNNEILKALLRSRPAGVNTYGNIIGTIKGEFGQTHQFQFSRASEIDVYVDIDVVTDRTFPAKGGEKIKNICAQHIGGEDLNGVFHSGAIGVGETVYQSGLETKLHGEISGVKSIEAKLGREQDNIVDDDLSLEDRETSITKPGNIFINRG